MMDILSTHLRLILCVLSTQHAAGMSTQKWSAELIPNVIDTQTTTFKVFVAVNISKEDLNQVTIQSICKVDLESDHKRLCPGEILDFNVSSDHTTSPWRILKPLLHFKTGVTVQQLIVTREAPPDVTTFESGFITCCMAEMSTSTYQQINATFIAHLTPNLPIDWSKSDDQSLSIDNNQIPKVSNCDSRNLDNRWWPFLCVLYDNSPYLGHFYTQTPPLLMNIKSFNAYQTPITSSKPVSTQGYRHGMPIRTSLNAHLTLPTSILNGRCAQTAPVRFLIDKTSECNVLVTEKLCSSNSILSRDSYLGERNDILVMADGYGDKTVNVTLNSFCGFCSENVSPRFNSRSNVCENVVSDVNYAFKWNGARLTSMHVTITLSNVTLSKKSYFRVRYSSSFVHENRQNNVSNFLRRPGYVMGEQLLTAARDANQTLFNINVTNSLRFIKSDGDGYCDAEGQSIKFGTDMIGGCKIPINKCQNQTESVTDWLCVTWLNSEWVSKTGSPELDNPQHFIQIIRDDDICIWWPTNETCVSPTLPMVWVSVTVLYANSGHQGQLPFHAVQGLRIRSWSNIECDTCVTSSVTLIMSVEFVQLPNLTSDTKKFWIKQNALPCSQDSCWAQMAHPFTAGHLVSTNEPMGEQISHLNREILLVTVGVAALIWTITQNTHVAYVFRGL